MSPIVRVVCVCARVSRACRCCCCLCCVPRVKIRGVAVGLRRVLPQLGNAPGRKRRVRFKVQTGTNVVGARSEL